MIDPETAEQFYIQDVLPYSGYPFPPEPPDTTYGGDYDDYHFFNRPGSNAYVEYCDLPDSTQELIIKNADALQKQS